MTAQTPTRPRKPKKKSRRGKFLVITLLVLGVLLVAADFALAAAGEYQIAQRMREKLQLREDPSVRINGFPFVLQAVRGDYQHVRIEANGVPVKDTLRDLDVEADLRHTRVPLSDLLAGNLANATIDEVEGSVRIKALDLNRLINQVTPFDKLAIEPDNRPQATVTPTPPVDPKAPKTNAAVKLSGTTNIAGKVVNVTAYGTVSLVSGTVQVSADQFELDDLTLPLDRISPQLKQAFAIPIDPGALPFAVTPTSIEVESGAFKIKGILHDVPLDGR